MARILVVDDRLENRDLVTAILGSLRHEVLVAEDGAAALHVVGTQKPDLIISDILMPSMDGFEFVRRLRQAPSAASIPVIFSSAHYLTAAAKALARACGVRHILPKPIEPEDLIGLVQTILAADADGNGVPDGDTVGTFGEAHLRLLTDQLAEHNRALALANGRLEAEVVERRQAEDAARAARDEALRASIEAERANLAKSKFLAAVSHDLRQPVQAMALFLPLVAEALGDHPQESAVRHLEHALSGLTNMLGLLLDVSKLDAGCIVPQPVRLSLDEMVRPLAAEYGLRAGKQKVVLRVAATNAATVSDPTLLERILRNLIENALTYTRSGSILIGCRRRGGKIRLDVVDTGIGIEADKLTLIFDEFYQVGNPERDRTKGLGLGLAIVKRLCKLLDHPIEVASTPGRGTRFSIFLPAVADRKGHQQSLATAPDSPGLSSRTVLVIDDEPLIRSGLACILRSWGYRVVAAESGDEAEATLATQAMEPDAIIVDYRLRDGETGLDAIRLLSDKVGRVVPSLVLTGDVGTDTIAAVRDAGFPLMHKPLSTGALQAAMTRLLANS